MNDRNNIVFVCSPLNGNYVKNIDNAKKFCRWIMLSNEENIAFAPHVFFTSFLHDDVESERIAGINGGIEILKACDEVMVFETYGSITQGMKEEIEIAEEFGKKITYIDNDTIASILNEENQ